MDIIQIKRVQMRRICIVLITTLPLLGTSGNVLAQKEPVLEEVIVTAQKREESLQDTPIAVSALSEDDLANIQYQDVTDLTAEVPNLQIRSTAGDVTGATISMRGTVTVNNNINFEPTVGIYLDGVFIAKNTGNMLDVVDLERIEVLRGPQGTLYGKNTIGGAINLVTKKPSGEFGLKAKAGGGEYNEKLAMISLDMPSVGQIGEGFGEIAAKVSYRRYSKDGWVDNEFFMSTFAEPPSSDTFGEKDDDAVRVSVLWDIAEKWSLLYSYDLSDMDRTPPFFQITRITPDGLFDPDGAGCNPIPIPGQCFSFTELHEYQSEDRLENGSNDRSFTDEARVDGHALTLQAGAFDAGFLGSVTIKSITARRKTDAFSLLDLDGSNVDIASFLRDIEYEQISQEFQLLGATERIDFVLGVYYFEEEAEVFNPGTFFGFFRQLGVPVNPVINEFGFENDAAALYGQLEWRPKSSLFDNRLTVAVGGRYTEEGKDFFKRRVESNGTVSVPRTEVDDNYYDFSPMVSASWDFDDLRRGYVKVAKGFKSGAFNHGATTPESFRIGFESEKLWSYELGFKSRWWNQRLQANAAVFYSDYRDIQVSNFIPDPNAGAVSIINNAGEAVITGAELELSVLVTTDVKFDVAYGYLDGDYKEYEVFDPDQGRTVDVKDERVFPFLAHNTARVGAEYRRMLGSMGQFGARVSWTYIDDQAQFSDNFESTFIDSYELVAGRLSLSQIPCGDGSQCSVVLWGQNLTDEEYFMSGIDFGAFGFAGNQFGHARSFGVQLGFTY